MMEPGHLIAIDKIAIVYILTISNYIITNT